MAVSVWEALFMLLVLKIPIVEATVEFLDIAGPLSIGGFDGLFPSFSPDGRWVAYSSDESGRPEVYVQAFPGPGPKIQISSGGGNDAVTGGIGALILTGLGMVVLRSQDDQRVLDRMTVLEATNDDLRERVDYLTQLLETALLPDDVTTTTAAQPQMVSTRRTQ